MILNTMRSVFIFALVFTLVFGTSYWYVETASVCPAPITYRLGDFDERFLISQTEALAVLAEAEAVWEKSAGRDLFVYDEEATFAINFIYDERQQLARTEEEWRTKLDIEEAESRGVIEQVKVFADAYDTLQLSYEASRTAYEERLAIYNKRVEELNDQGGAAKDVFEELQAEQKKITKQLDELLALEEDLNDRAQTINELGEKGNRLIEEYNINVQKYNEIYGNRDLYTQGDFKRDRINIYKFSDKTELTKVIAHEFGHALGVGHVEGGESIMYYLMAEQPDTIALSEEDRQALIVTCGEGSLASDKIRRIIRTTLSYLK
jgi:Matrixin